MQVKNTDPRFGFEGPFETESYDAFVEAMFPVLNGYASLSWDEYVASHPDVATDPKAKEKWLEQKATELELDLISALVVVGDH